MKNIIKLEFMTNREYVKKISPDDLNEFFDGGVRGCPEQKKLQNYFRANKCVKSRCTDCWNLPAKINGRYILKVSKTEGEKK